jgi:GTP-binding protein
MADIPGIIEGASEGAGLGHDFLRHIDRCRLLIHVVDVSGSEGRDALADFDAINEELRQYNPELYARPQLVAANKRDIADEETVQAFRRTLEARGYTVFEISAAAHTGVRELTAAVSRELAALPPIAVFEPDYVPPAPEPATAADLTIENYDDVWSIEGIWLERLVANTNFTDHESRMHFNRMLETSGVSARLEELGIQEGDTVSIYNLEFEYTR